MPQVRISAVVILCAKANRQIWPTEIFNPLDLQITVQFHNDDGVLTDIFSYSSNVHTLPTGHIDVPMV